MDKTKAKIDIETPYNMATSSGLADTASVIIDTKTQIRGLQAVCSPFVFRHILLTIHSENWLPAREERNGNKD
jgi:hypothetical protein